MHWRRVLVPSFVVALAAMLALTLWLVPEQRSVQSHELRFTALDVGEGDAILVQTPNGSDVLIDGGPDATVVERLSRHLPPSDRDLELVVLTHPDADHVNGLAIIASQFRIDRVLETGVRAKSKADGAWVAEVRRQKSEVTDAAAGTSLTLDGVRFDVLWPVSDADVQEESGNDTSVVLRVTYGETSFLLSGDISAVVEDRLIRTGTLSDVDVLKVGHHGSISSTSEEYLDAVRPEIAVISVGQGNKFGHPHPSVLRRLRERGVEVMRTDELGDVELVSNGISVSLRE